MHKIYGHHLKGRNEKQSWYIGRTGEEKLEDRWKNGKAYKRQPKFYNAIDKYGWNVFEHVFIAECETEEQAILAEAIFKRIYDSVDNGYNCSKLPEDKSPMTGLKHTDASKKKISAAGIGNKRTLGRKHSDEEKEKISKSLMGRYCSEETRLKIAKANTGKERTMETKMKLRAISTKGKTWKIIDGKRVWLDKEST